MLTFLIIFIGCVCYYSLKSSRNNAQKEIEIQISSLANEDVSVPVAGTNPVMDVRIKENNIDTSRIIEYTGEIPRKFEFRPENFSQFIGQEEAKERRPSHWRMRLDLRQDEHGPDPRSSRQRSGGSQ